MIKRDDVLLKPIRKDITQLDARCVIILTSAERIAEKNYIDLCGRNADYSQLLENDNDGAQFTACVVSSIITSALNAQLIYNTDPNAQQPNYDLLYYCAKTQAEKYCNKHGQTEPQQKAMYSQICKALNNAITKSLTSIAPLFSQEVDKLRDLTCFPGDTWRAAAPERIYNASGDDQTTQPLIKQAIEFLNASKIEELPLTKSKPAIFLEETHKGILNNEFQERKFLLNKSKNASVVVTINQAATIQGLEHLNNFDKLIADGTAALYNHGHYNFSVEQLYRLINGLPGDVSIKNDAVLKEIESSLYKCSQTWIQIKYDGSSKHFQHLQGKYEGHVLSMDRLTLSTYTNGKKSKYDAWRILTAPPLQSFSNDINQVASCPNVLLRTPNKNTKENILLRSELLRAIYAIKGGHLSHYIRLDTLFKNADIELTTPITPEEKTAFKKKQAKRREQVALMLDHWTKENFIQEWSWHKENKTITSIKIVLPPLQIEGNNID